MKRRDFLKTSVIASAALSLNFEGLQAALSTNTVAVEKAPDMVAVMGGEPEVMLDKALEQLELRGAIVNDSTKINLLLDVSCIENWEKYQINLENLYESKGELFQKALEIPFSQVADTDQDNGIISFPYFKSTINKKELLSDIQFAQIVSSYAENNRTVSQKKSENQNDKFMMRTWLVRAGMVGEEYKFARKMLTKNLEGNSAWQKMMEPTEIESKEVCNQAQSEEMMDNHVEEQVVSDLELEV